MYCVVLIISLAMAAPPVSRTCYTLCELQRADPLHVAPRDCNCSLSAEMDTASTSKEIALLDDTGVYFIPAEANLFQTQFTPQPFLISNPVKFNTNRIKKGSPDKKDYSDESTERVDTYERRKTLIRVSTDSGSLPPSYLDLEIQDEANSETSAIQQDNYLPSFESAEKVLAECLDLHILEFTRQHGMVENFSEFWEARNLKIYEDLSDSDLNEKITKLCSETEDLIKQSLAEIQRGIPKKKVNVKYFPESKHDNSKKHETEESVQSYEFRSFSSMTEPTSIDESRTGQPSLLTNSIVSKYEGSLEGASSPDLSHNTSQHSEKINESKSDEINSHIFENTLSEITIITTKNTADDTEDDMDTMASDVIFKTINETNHFDFKLATNQHISDETATLFISTTPLSDVLSFRDTSSVIKTPWSEKQRNSSNIVLDYTTPSEDTLKINNQINESNNAIIRKEPFLDKTTILSASKTSITEELSVRDISRPVSVSAGEGERTTEYAFDVMPSVILNSNNQTNESKPNFTSNEVILDIDPALTTLKYSKFSHEDLSRNASMADKEEYGKDEEDKDFDLDTKPSGVNLKLNNETNNIATDLILDNTTLYSKSKTPKNAGVLPGDASSASETFNVEKKENEDDDMLLDIATISSDSTFKSSNEPLTRNKLNSHDITLFPTESTLSLKYKTPLDDEMVTTEQPMSKLSKKQIDGDVDLELNTSYTVMDIADSTPTLEDTSKLTTSSEALLLNEKPPINTHEENIFKTGPEEDTSVSFISTTPGIAVQFQRRNKFRENELQIPSIITKECQNNVVQSFINGEETLPNKDFPDVNEKLQSFEEKNEQVKSDDFSDLNSISSVEGKDSLEIFNNSYISGNLYFGSSQELVPVRLVQTDSGKVSLGIDGHSLCEKLKTSKGKSLLLSTLCDCVHKMTKNNSTEYLNK